MTTYVAPVRDMLFAITELAGLDEVAALPGCEEVSADLVEAILDEAGKFAGEVLAPLNQVGDREGSRLVGGGVVTPQGFREAYRKFVDNGWTTLAGKPEFGGQGLPYVVAMPVQETWKAANLAFSLCPMLTQGAIEALVHHGTPTQQQLFIPRMLKGEWTGTMNLTEPQAGSDLSAVRSKAVPEGDHYRITGTKIFITWGDQDITDNIVHLVLARLPDAPEGVKGISLFVVPKFLVNPDGSLGARNDVQCVSLEHKMGIHASPTAVLSYGERGGAVGYLVGAPNRGLEYMFTMMNHARLNVGLEGVAIAERAYQAALAYAKERVQGRPAGLKAGERITILHHPDVRRMLMSMKAQVEAMRALAYFTAAAMDKAGRHPDAAERKRNQMVVDLLTPVVKGWSTEQSIEIASTGIQVHGGMGYIEETGACQHLRDARITTIYEGTTGIQANDLIGRKLARESGVTARALIADMRASEGIVSSLAGEDCAAIGAALRRGIDDLEAATDWLLETSARDPGGAAAGAVPYLKLFGTVAGGWQMARAAVRSHARVVRGEGDTSFYRAKIATARFYAEHVLSLSPGYRQAVTRGAGATMALEEGQF